MRDNHAYCIHWTPRLIAECFKFLTTTQKQRLEWMQLVNAEERALIRKRAVGASWKVICKELGCCRAHASYKWKVALTKISSRLNDKNYKRDHRT